MGLSEELKLKSQIPSLSEETVLSIYHTGSMIKKSWREIFRHYGITDVQFNVLSLLHLHPNADGGLTQAELSEMMLVNRANITPLIDRMEKAELVRRAPVPGDRRYHSIQLLPKGSALLKQVLQVYKTHYLAVLRGFEQEDLAEMVGILDRVRGNIDTMDYAGVVAAGRRPKPSGDVQQQAG